MMPAKRKPRRKLGKRTGEAFAWQFAFDNADRLESVRIYADGKAWVELEGCTDKPPPGPCVEFLVKLPDKLEWINSELVAAGWPDMSPYWRKQLARVYTSNWIAREKLFVPHAQRRAFCWRIGRRGGKSSTICRVAVFECLWGGHDVPPGDIGVYAIISAERGQAKDRVSTISKICEVLGVGCKPLSEEIRFTDSNVAVRCITASITAVVSFTCIGAMCDEEAIWRDEKEGINPAKDILRSLTPTITTQPNAVIHHVSAPWSTLDEHHKMYELGNTQAQLVFYAPTWIANPHPSASEAATHLLEPDWPTWERSFKAIPMAADETKFFNAALISAAVKHETGALGWNGVAAGADLAFMRDSSALVISSERDAEPVSYRVEAERVWAPGSEPLRPGKVFAELMAEVTLNGAESVCSDTHYFASMREHADDNDVAVVPFPADTAGIAEAFVRLRVLFGFGQIDLSQASEQLVDELKQTVSKPLAGGLLRIDHPRIGHSHGDLARAFACSVYAAERASLGGEREESDRTFAPRRMSRAGRHEPAEMPGTLRDYAPNR